MIVDVKNKNDLISLYMSSSPYDRKCRFFISVNDSYIERYFNSFNFEKNKIFGIIKDKKLVSVCEIVFDNKDVEVAFFTHPKYRGLGFASKLLDETISYCKSNKVEKIYSNCLYENSWMLNLVKSKNFITKSDIHNKYAYILLE